jgi:hypothetical protein
MEVDVRLERMPLRTPIRITGYTFVDARKTCGAPPSRCGRVS